MENRKILVDTSVFIDFLRKKDKTKTYFWQLMDSYECAISAISIFELLSGAKDEVQVEDVANILDVLNMFSYDDTCAEISAEIYKTLKSRNKMIEFRDIFIASVAIANDLALATMNKKHFNRIKNLTVLK